MKTLSKQMGIVYCAIGEKYLQMALRSAATVIQTTPNVLVTIVTDIAVKEIPYQIVTVSPTKNRYIKTTIGKFVTGNTLFLDADTIVVGDLSPIFEFLDDYDLAVCVSQRSRLKYYPEWAIAAVGMTGEHTHYSSGVFGFSSRIVPEFFDNWLRLYQITEKKVKADQLSFAAAIHQAILSGTKVLSLPSVWNVRSQWGDSVYSDVKVFHTHLMEDDPSLKNFLANREVHSDKSKGPRWVKNHR